MKQLLVTSTTVLVCLCTASCGAGNHTNTATKSSQATASVSSSTAEPTAARPSDHDNDNDSTSGKRHDSDDLGILDFGHAANASDRAKITALVRTYYAVAAAEDGAKACSLIYSVFAEAVPENYGTSPPGPSYARGPTCPAVLTAIFKHFHSGIVARLPKLKVVRVRVKEHQGLVILSFGAMLEREMRVFREGHIWTVLSVVDTDLP